MLTPIEATAIASAVTSGSLGFVIGLRANDIRGIGYLHGTWTEVHPRELAEQIRTGQLKAKNLDKRTRAVVLAEMARQANGITAAESAEFLALDGIAGRFTHVTPPAAHPCAEYEYRKAA
ncbi:hypothetical protein [Actinospica robiniae]|uniref:hypothetical protein n=1 Tax=Actinospica robiniae TaxID=304901 RepID=UPI000417C12F|nr:hypothetical protein [Actinospica robiniae]